MIAELRRRFNAGWTPAKYAGFLEGIDRACGTHVKFRLAETPCFFPRPLIQAMVEAGRELVLQAVSNAAMLEAAARAIPDEFRCPHTAPHPMFIQADFGISRERASGALVPKLVEIQGFPSLYLFQPVMAAEYAAAYGLDTEPGLDFLLGGRSFDEYVAAMRSLIVGDHDPRTVILLEIDPRGQKTLPDFLVTERLLGVRAVDIAGIEREGRNLFYRDDAGRHVPVRRIYNRAISDELIRRNARYAFRFSDELDVEWAGHPNWYFLLSKFSIPWFEHPSVPRTLFLDRIGDDVPGDLERWVLKPLYSFAGLGVSVGPTRAETDAIPRDARHNYILQERVDFLPLIETPEGPTKAEVRVMYVWPDGAAAEGLEAVTTIVRMGRGKMMGVDHNRDMAWVGASAGFVATATAM